MLGYFLPILYAIAQPTAFALGVLIVADIWLLFFTKGDISLERSHKERFSHSDDNEVIIYIKNDYRFTIKAAVYDELPFQFQIRNFKLGFKLSPGQSESRKYVLRPTERGQYDFGNINALVRSGFGLVYRRTVCKTPASVKVYPSFIKLHQYELIALSQQLTMQGQKRVRKVGNSQEFDTIRDYVRGDDPRHINWSATARRGHLMTNHYIDERSQSIYCVIDKSRIMKMPFDGITLLDYAINASLVMADISLKKGDRAGLLTFEDNVDTFVKAGNRSLQLHHFMESLYKQSTSFKEPDIASVYNFVRKNINQRSLLLFFTNFESIHSLNRQLPHLQLLNREHLLLVIYFRNTEVDHIINEKASSTKEIYNQAIAFQMLDEKLLIKETLNKAGILTLYSTPQKLNVNVINKYIEVKAKRML